MLQQKVREAQIGEMEHLRDGDEEGDDDTRDHSVEENSNISKANDERSEHLEDRILNKNSIVYLESLNKCLASWRWS